MITRGTDVDGANAWEVFQRYRDEEWGVTDGTREVVVERLGIPHAFASDTHCDPLGTARRVP
jgi:predicted nucleic acid-binding protein